MSANKTSVLYEAQDMRFEDRKLPEPGSNDVLLKINSVGICGSDVHYWWKGRTGRFVVESPLVLGHESSARVVKCGSKVTNLNVGDRVAIEPGIPCRQCKHCKIGRYNVCPKVKFCATPPVDGTLTQFYVHPADFCFKLPDHVTNEEGALVEPLAVAVYSCKRAEVQMGSKVLILGAGPIGIVSLLTSKAFGASIIVVTDINEERLSFAKTYGATHTINVTGKSNESIVHNIQNLMHGGPSAIIECSGAVPSYNIGILAGAPNSIMVTVGRGSYDVTIPVATAASKEMKIRGIFRYANCYEVALDMIATGRVNVKPLVTHRYEFHDVLKAFHAAKDGLAMKVMINISD